MGQIYLASGKNYSGEQTIRGILVTPSAGSWVCILKDSTGKTLFSAVGAAATSEYFPITITADAFNQTTATNITAIMLYT